MATRKRTKRMRTRIVVVLDSSGSMLSCKDAAIDGFNDFVRAQAAEMPDAPLTLYTFNYTVVRKLDTTVSAAPLLNSSRYIPGGGTALYDALGTAMKNTPAKAGERVLFLVITDGQENSSDYYTHEQVARLRGKRQATGRWTFVYIGANHDAFEVAGSLGIPRLNTMTYDSSYVGTQNMMTTTQQITQQFLASPQAATTSFFQPSLGSLSPTKVQRNLVPMRPHEITVRREDTISSVVADNLGSYTPGRAYYQLTKPEKVDAGRDILIRERSTGKVYGGLDARYVLNMPEGNVRVSPGNHGDWDIFIQSRSHNRLLVRGTRVLVL